jgi:hypothetical protein
MISPLVTGIQTSSSLIIYVYHLISLTSYSNFYFANHQYAGCFDTTFSLLLLRKVSGQFSSRSCPLCTIKGFQRFSRHL